MQLEIENVTRQDRGRAGEATTERDQAPTLTDAVRLALQHEIERAHKAHPMSERLAKAVALADAMGPTDPGFDMKRFSDEQSGDA